MNHVRFRSPADLRADRRLVRTAWPKGVVDMTSATARVLLPPDRRRIGHLSDKPSGSDAILGAMNRVSLALAFAVVLFVSTNTASADQSPALLRVTAERTSVRERPATDGIVVATVERGTTLQLLEESGSWFRVRVQGSSQEGFVYNQFVSRVQGSATASPAPATPSASGTSANAGRQTSGLPVTGGPAPLENRKLGAGLMGSGYGFVPSIRYWFDGKKGAEANFWFDRYLGYTVYAVSPSLLIRFKEPKVTESVTFYPYLGGGITWVHSSADYRFAYCGEFVDCSDSSIGFGAFVGTEAVFPALPKLPISGNVGFFSSAYGFGGLYIGVGGHYYF